MLSDDGDVLRSEGERHCTKEAEFPVADHCNFCLGLNVDLLCYPKRSRERLRKHGLVVRHIVGHNKKIPRRQSQKLGVSTVASDDAEDRPFRTMSRIARD